MGRTHGTCSASMLERLKDQKIGQKNMTITCTGFPSGRRGRDDADADCFFGAAHLPTLLKSKGFEEVFLTSRYKCGD